MQAKQCLCFYNSIIWVEDVASNILLSPQVALVMLHSKVVILLLLLLIHFYIPAPTGCVFAFGLGFVIKFFVSFLVKLVFILLRKRELLALLYLNSCCHVVVFCVSSLQCYGVV